ncbi:MAG: 2-hydroxyglutaryl-CoA dehydratase [Polyangiaceae bacterium]|nr:2-hydroxyglutaryl-CoA dehydratase [Polyangiaceae bacterium]
MSHQTSPHREKRRLPLAEPLFDVEAELAKFEAEEKQRLGVDVATEHWAEEMVGLGFTRSERSRVTMLIGGLTRMQDSLIEGALKGIGYKAQWLGVPDSGAFQVGKEFGNRGQCNPTYFTVGNLLRYLVTLRDKHGMTSKEIIDQFVFVTAGACGPCRFGMYVTEYRKALRDAGFDGFRVLLFEQTGAFHQATGEGAGLELNGTFFWALFKGGIAGDVLNAYGYRVRPYEKVKGATNEALEKSRKILYEALEKRTNILVALWRCKSILAAVEVDKTVAKPKVSIIGEFWAMTTEGDGNYQLQSFLEQEGAECDVQPVTAWLLYTLWEMRNDTHERADLRAFDEAARGLGKSGPFAVFQKFAISYGGDFLMRVLFQTFAHTAGLYGYTLANMDEIARTSHDSYNTDLRGGEGHMEVGKLISNVVHKKAHMTLSVKPFGCMPSSGVSDGVQSAIIEKYPGTIFCPVETSGDGRVNFYSRVQMYLFKAKQVALSEYEGVLAEHRVTKEEVSAVLASNARLRSPLYKARHRYAGSAADMVAAAAPYIRRSRTERLCDHVIGFVEGSTKAAQKAPDAIVNFSRSVLKRAPVMAERMREDLTLYREMRAQKKKVAAGKRSFEASEVS